MKFETSSHLLSLSEKTGEFHSDSCLKRLIEPHTLGLSSLYTESMSIQVDWSWPWA